MLKSGDTVVIRGSKSLDSMRLSNLNKKRGVIDKVVCSDGKPIAAYVIFKKQRTEKTVLVPIKSLEGISTVNRIRTMNLLKNTIL